MKLRALSYLVVFALGVVLCAIWHSEPEQVAVVPEIARQLEDIGFDATVSAPTVIRDAPRHTRPVATISGGIPFGPEHRPDVPAESPLPETPACPGPLTADDLGGDCVTEIVAAGEHPFARIWWTGRARTPSGIIERTERVPDVAFAWSPPAVPPRRSMELRVGVSSRAEIVAGATVYGSGRRVGFWGEAIYPVIHGRPTSVSAGVAVRF